MANEPLNPWELDWKTPESPTGTKTIQSTPEGMGATGPKNPWDLQFKGEGYQGPDVSAFELIGDSLRRAGSGVKASIGGLMQEQETVPGQVAEAGATRGFGIKPSLAAMQLMLQSPRLLAEGADRSLTGEISGMGQEISDAATMERIANPIRAKDGSFGYYMSAGVEMLVGDLLPMAAVGVAAGPGAGLSLMASKVYGDKFQQSLREGRTPGQASMDGFFYALSETATERIPLGKALEQGVGFWKRVGGTGLSEAGGEVLNSIAQRMYDKGVVDEGTTVSEFLLNIANDEGLREMRDSAILGTAGGAVMAGATHGFVQGQEREQAEAEVGGRLDEEIPPIEEAVPEAEPTPITEPVPVPVPEPVPEPPTPEPAAPEPVTPEPEAPVPEAEPIPETVAPPEPVAEAPKPTPEAPIPVSPDPTEASKEEFITQQLLAIEARQEELASREDLKYVQKSGVPRRKQQPSVSNVDRPDFDAQIPDDVDLAAILTDKVQRDAAADRVDQALADRLDEIRDSGKPMSDMDKASIQATIEISDRLRAGEQAKDFQHLERAIRQFSTVSPGYANAVNAALNVSVAQRLGQAKGGTVSLVGFRDSKVAPENLNLSKNVLSHWLKRFAPDEKIVLVDSNTWTDVAKNFGRRTSNNAWGAMSGSVLPAGKGIVYMRANFNQIGLDFSKVKKEAVYATLAHEFGHMLELKYFNQASPMTQKALLLDYRTWLRERIRQEGKETMRDFYESRDTPWLIERRPDSIVLDSLMEYNKKDRTYTLSFSEYLAQQVARYAHQDPTMLEPVKRLIKPLYEKLIAFFKANSKWLPNKSVTNWLDSLQYKVELERLQKEQIKKTPTEALLASGEMNSVAAGLERLDKAAGGNTGILSKNDRKADYNGDPEMLSKGTEPTARSLVRFGKFSNLMLTLTQVEDRNQSVPGVRRYTEAVRKWWADKSAFTQMADTRAREMLRLPAKELAALSRFVHEQTVRSDELQRSLRKEEKIELMQDLGIELSEEAQRIIEGTKEDFHKILNTVFDVLESDLPRRYQHLDAVDKAEVIKAKRAELRKERREMLDRDYWPLSRFGKYWVQAKAKSKMSFQGQNFKKGSVFLFETYQTEAEQRKRHAELKRSFGDQADVGGSIFSDTVMTFQGMPPQLITKLQQMMEAKIEAQIAATDPEDRDAAIVALRGALREQLTGLDHVLHDLAPGNSFKNRLQRRKKTPGYSMDAVRGYASYMQGAANHVSRIMNYGEMMDSIDMVKMERMRSTTQGIDNNISQLEMFLRDHYEYAMNPGEEWAHLRAIGFLWYLGFNLKSAAVNMSQIPMFTMPYLTKRFGNMRATKEMAKAFADIRKLIEDGKGLEPELLEAIDLGRKAGFLEESLATELSALAEGSNLQRLLPGSFLKSEVAARSVRTASHWGAYMFQKIEQMNRYGTFIGAFRLQLQKELDGRKLASLTEQEKRELLHSTFLSAREAVEKTQFEYARWNRPRFMRGRWSSVFLFKMYMQNALYFVATDPAKVRYLIMLTALAGLSGLPGAEDLTDLVKAMAKGARWATGREDIVLPNKAQTREFIKSLNQDPDLWLNGVSHDLFGLWDMSGSIGQGRVVPGLGPVTDMAGGNLTGHEMWGKAGQEIAGAAWGIPIQMINAITSDSPDVWREAEKSLPKAIANLSKAYRWKERENISNYSGHPLPVEFDPTDELHSLEIAGQALGFTPSRVSRYREMSWSRKETVQYWLGRRRVLLRQMSYDYTQGNRESKADLNKAIKKFNKAVPDKTLKIGADDRRNSILRRRKAEMKSKHNRPGGMQGRGLYKDFEEAWDEESP